MRLRIIPFIFFSFFFISCQSGRGIIYSLEGAQDKIVWTGEEKVKDIAIRRVRATDEASFHWIRLRTAEKLHVHEYHDGTVTVLSGKVGVMLGERYFVLKPGDVLEIMRGTKHKAENLAKEPSEAYVIFTPPYDGNDMNLVENL